MKNLPYSTPATKKQALIQVQQANRGSGMRQIFILFLALPASFFFFSKTQWFQDFAGLASDQSSPAQAYTALVDSLSPNLQAANDEIVALAQKTAPALEDLKISAASSPGLSATNEAEAGLPMEFASVEVTREDILSDRFNRIPEVFKVPASLRPRVGFWFDIYTRYGSRHTVIHHVDHPWLIFKVVDVSPIYAGPGHKWTKYHRAQAAVKKALEQVRRDLKILATKKRPANLTTDQLRYWTLLSDLPGKRSSVFRHAASHVRSQLGQKDFYRGGIISASKYLPQMEEIFAQYDLPTELTRLPLVESSFNENAISKVGASGIWQFMPHIGRSYMKVTETIDERNSPLKATEAAAKLMLANFRMLKNWPFALTAYNHGPGGIRKASKALKTEDLSLIIEKYNSDRFGFASSNFYTSFLAALHGERYQDEIFGEISKYPPHRSDSIKLTQRLRVGTLASIAGITMEELRLYNKDLKAKAVSSQTWLPAHYRVFVPQGRKARVELYQIELAEAAKTKRASAPKRLAQKKRKGLQAEEKQPARRRKS